MIGRDALALLLFVASVFPSPAVLRGQVAIDAIDGLFGTSADIDLAPNSSVDSPARSVSRLTEPATPPVEPVAPPTLETWLRERKKSAGEIGFVDVLNTRLNVRSGPGMGHRIVGKLYPADRVRIVGRKGSWLKVQWRGGTAWVCSFYVWRKGGGVMNDALRRPIRRAFGPIRVPRRRIAEWPGTWGQGQTWRGISLKTAKGRKSRSSRFGSAGKVRAGGIASSRGRVRKDGGLAIPVYDQTDPRLGARSPSSYCGPTSLKMVLEYYGIRKHVNVAAKGVMIRGVGAGHAGMLRRLRTLGLKRSYLTYGKSLAWLKEQTRKGFPVIVGVRGRYYPGVNTSGHILVVAGFTKSGKVILNDSGLGKRIHASVRAFLGAWRNAPGGGVGIVVRGKAERKQGAIPA